MTNQGLVGFPGGASQDGSIPLGKLSAPQGFGRLVSGRYYFTSSPFSTNTSSVLGVGSLRTTPWVVPNACTLSRIGAEVVTGTSADSGAKVRLGIYADDGTGYPGALAFDAGTIAGDSVAVQELTVSLSLAAGLYWVAAAVQVVVTTQPTMRCTNTAAGMFNLQAGTSTPASNLTFCGYSASGGATGAFPSLYPSGGAVTTLVPRVFVKIA